MKELTKAEEQIMKILWNIEKGVIHDIIKEMDAPKPAYNTVSTIVRILETKGFIGHKAYGKTYEYFPLIAKKKYTHFYLNQMLNGYFSGSINQLVSFFAKENELDVSELEQLIENAKSSNQSQSDD